ncbi:MAG: hypothetical protein ACKOQ3_12430 [Novosphingobium sp.]
MTPLVLHPDCAAGSIRSIEAAIESTPGGCRATFVARGDVARIAVPPTAEPGRYDNLWKTTCFEIFWSHDGTSYREFNLSPSTRWACYDFDAFREGMRDAPAEVEVAVAVSATELRLTAEIRSDLPLPATVALNAIIEDADGINRFWALAFRPGAPEFHADQCRALELGA